MKNPLSPSSNNSVFIAALACIALHSFQAFAEPRLIKYGPALNDVKWMNQDSINVLTQRSHDAGHCGGYMDITDHQSKSTRQPLPVFVAPDIATFTGPQYPHVVTPLIQQLSAANIQLLVENLSAFPNRHYRSEHGAQSMNWVRDRFIQYSAGRSDIRVELVTHRFTQPSVVARIEGRGQRADEVVVIGGHGDSINQIHFWGEMHAPGADDNASGTATVLETFRVLAQSGFVPDRSIEFMIYAGEEVGLLGSQDIAERYKDNNKAVVGVMQLDMTMYPGSSRVLTLITDHTNPALTDLSKILIDSYVQHPWIADRCGYACSDHASWTDAGYASVFPFEAKKNEMNGAIHSTNDLLSRLDPNFGLHFAKLAVAFAVEISGIVL